LKLQIKASLGSQGEVSPMKKASYLSWFVAILVGMVLAFPPGLAAQSQSAGSIAREIPNVSLEHNRKAQLAAAGTKISWGDNVVTDQGGRARIVLDDG